MPSKRRQDQKAPQEAPEAPSGAPAEEGQGEDTTQGENAPQTGRRPGQAFDDQPDE